MKIINSEKYKISQTIPYLELTPDMVLLYLLGALKLI